MAEIGMFLLRPYRPTDLAMLVTVDAACFRKEFLFGRPLMQRLIETAQALTLIAETASGEPAGFAIAHCDQAGEPGTAYLVTLDVLPETRRHGVGAMLLSAAEQSICGGGAQRMDLHVWTENRSAIRFYEKQGYDLRSRVSEFYGRTKGDAFLYSKNLGSSSTVSRPPCGDGA